ncbi:hypothetical protein Taro_020157 [Colocasia esculenta]|uniref:Uncharacterized protein n=1 Tax=Colocasia esculenta TaxID=4460 RepID=A0A843UYU4_COLES|nr:hypothetical protein [Colocasia esculenta]
MAPKQLPHRGAKSRASARPNPEDDVPPTERRTKRRHDPAEQPGSSSAKRESSQPSRRPPSKPLSAGKTILKPRAVDLDDSELIAAFPEEPHCCIRQRPTPVCGALHPALCLRDPRPLASRLYPAASPLHHVLASHARPGLASTASASRRPRKRPWPPSLRETVSALPIVKAPTPQAALRSAPSPSPTPAPAVAPRQHHHLCSPHHALLAPKLPASAPTGPVTQHHGASSVTACEWQNNIFCKGSVDTTILGVDTMVQNKGRNVKKSPSQVNTSPEQVDTTSSQVDTRDLSQGSVLPVWDSVSTHLLGRSTHSGISARSTPPPSSVDAV